jgi:hypothetical protein
MSFSIDFGGVLDQAGEIFNGLFPILIFPVGITLGIALLGFIFNAVRNSLKGM